jgi:hypothetical protein
VQSGVRENACEFLCARGCLFTLARRVRGRLDVRPLVSPRVCVLVLRASVHLYVKACCCERICLIVLPHVSAFVWMCLRARRCVGFRVRVCVCV